MLNKEAIVIDAFYWNMVYGKEIGVIYNDVKGIQNTPNLGEGLFKKIVR